MVGSMAWGVADEQGWRKGPWTPEEDKLLSDYISLHGDGRWSSVAKFSGLNRNGKSCRLRWVNYLRPDLKKGNLTSQEEGIIIELHAIWGNKWSTIARYLPGRTDNEIKNYWRTHFKVKSKPFERREKRKSEALRQKKHHLLEENNDKNKCTSTNDHNIGEVNNEKITELQGNQDMVFAYDANSMEYHHPSPVINFQDVAPWQETIVEDDLWGIKLMEPRWSALSPGPGEPVQQDCSSPKSFLCLFFWSCCHAVQYNRR